MLTYINQSNIVRLFLLLAITIVVGCKKFVQIDPPVTQITGKAVYNNNTSAAAAMTSIYDNMMTSPGFSSGNNSLSYLGGLLSDELKNFSTDQTLSQFYSNTLTSSSNGSSNLYFWNELYNELYVSNAVIEGLTNSTNVTESIKKQLIGEAKFMRAFFHFYAVNLYGDVPLVTTTDYKVNNTLTRTPIPQVYQQIIADLKDAEDRLGIGFVDYGGSSTHERIRPNKGAAAALLARVYLYTNKWDSSESQATQVINNSGYALSTNLDSAFLANSPETIWQLQPVNPGYNTIDGQYLVLTTTPGTGLNYVALDSNLLNAFELADKRLAHWIGIYADPSSNQTYYFPYKYKIYLIDVHQPVTEYTMVLRLAEQYLIRAEARAQKGNIQGAQADLNAIRVRAGLDSTRANDQPSLLAAILHERQTELFTEWGHRWLDLKRTGTVNSVMSIVTPQKGGFWRSNWALMPLPLSEVTLNPNMLQNPGY